MNRIEVRGVIVPSMFDTGWTQSYIEKGVITPESKFRRDLLAADTSKDLTLYLNTPGGSVFAGNEMMNVVKDWVKQTGRKLSIVVGSMAASMGANMLISLPGKISAHKNAKIMFHGVTTCMCGGAQALEDEAELVNKMNDEIKTALVSKTSLSPDEVAVWFNEGREGWLTAERALEVGLIDAIIGEDAEAVEITEETKTMLKERGLDLAAVADIADHQAEDTDADENESEDEEETADDSESENGDEDSDADESESDDSDTGEDESESEDADESEEETEEQTDQLPEVVELSNALEKATHECRKLQSANDKLKAEMAESKKAYEMELIHLQAKMEEAKKANEALTARVSKLSLQASRPAETENSVRVSWETAVKECKGDYAEAKKRFPAAHKAFFEASQK